MTLVVTVIALGLAYAYWLFAGASILPGVTVFEAAYAAGVLTAVLFALRSREKAAITAAIVVAANWAASLFAWSGDDTVTATIAIDLVTATWFAIKGEARWELGLAALFGLSAAAGVGVWGGVVPEGYGGSFLEWSFPSLTAVCGHLANVTLGMGAGDAGRRVRRVFGVRPVPAGGIGPVWFSRLRRGTVVASEAAED